MIARLIQRYVMGIFMRRVVWWLPPIIIAGYALLALWTNAGLPLGADVDVHYWRAFFLERNWAQGELLPRWAEEAYFGYGAPVLQYTALGAYAVSVIVGWLPFVDDVWRIKVLWALGAGLASVGMYRYAGHRWGVWGGLIGAGAFLLSPYMMYYEPLRRASFPVVLAYGCLLFSLSALDAYARERRSAWQVMIFLPLMMLAHNLTAIIGAGLLGGWLLWVTLFARGRFPHIWRAWGLFTVGGMVSAYFWLPLAFERAYVSLDRLSAIPELDFRYQFLSFGTLFGAPIAHDMTLYTQPHRFSLGVVVWLCALVGVLLLITWRKRHDRAVSELVYWGLVAGGAIFLAMPLSLMVWEQFSVLALFQFPSRFLGMAGIGLAMLCAPVGIWLTGRWRVVFLPLLMAFFIMGWQTTPSSWYADYRTSATAEAYFNYEIERGILGTTATNEFLPRTTVNIPPATSFVMESFDEAIRQRVNVYLLPEDVTVTPIASSPTAYEFHISTPETIRLEVLLTYFELWQATLNGEAHPLDLNEAFGMVALEIPAGDHHVRLFYPHTTFQQVGLWVSGLALLLGVVWVVREMRHAPVASDGISVDGFSWRLLGALVLILPLLAIVIMRDGVGWVRSSSDEVLVASVPLAVNFDDSMTLLGYDVELAQRGLPVRLSLFWRLDATIGEGVHSFVHLLNSEGVIVAQHDKFNMTRFTSESAWDYAYHHWDYYVLPPPDELRAGDYRVRVGLWRCDVPDATFSECPNVERLVVTSGEQGGAEVYYFEEVLSLR